MADKNLDVPDYSKDTNLGEDFTVKDSPVNDFEYVDNIEFDQGYEAVSQRQVLAAPSNTGGDIFGRIESNRQVDEGYWKLIIPSEVAGVEFDAIVVETFIGGAGGGGTYFKFGYMEQLPGAAPGGAVQFYLPGYVSPFDDGVYDLGSSTEQWNTIYLVNAPVVSSDGRLKKDVKELPYGLKEVLALRPVSFKRIDDKNPERNHVGFIAQEVKEIIPEAILGSLDTKLGMTYETIIPVLVNAIRELNEKIVKLEKDKMV